MKIAWLTDLHLNFADDEAQSHLWQEVNSATPDVILVGGDIGEADSFDVHLRKIADECPAPVYFVLGNHDYYHGSIFAVRQAAVALSEECENLHWLPPAGVVKLTSRTALVGHGGWGDARSGNFMRTSVTLNDYRLIRELVGEEDYPASTGSLITRRLEKKLNILGDQTAEHFRNVLPAALDDYEHVVVLMHVPPLREACWHDGRISDDDWAPHFVCQAAGEAIVELMQAHPKSQTTVLCGHTHSSGEAQILPNLRVMTGAAEYRLPAMQPLLTVQ